MGNNALPGGGDSGQIARAPHVNLVVFPVGNLPFRGYSRVGPPVGRNRLCGADPSRMTFARIPGFRKDLVASARPSRVYFPFCTHATPFSAGGQISSTLGLCSASPQKVFRALFVASTTAPASTRAPLSFSRLRARVGVCDAGFLRPKGRMRRRGF